MMLEWPERGPIDADMVQGALDRFEKVIAFDKADLPPVIAVVGAFSRGKSALINAVIGLPLLPVHPLPTTALPTQLVYADTLTASILYPDREVPIAIQSLSTLTLLQDMPSLIEGATAIKIGCPSPILASGIVILDTPGIDAPNSASFVMPGDVAVLLVVFAADPPLGAEEMIFIVPLARQAPYVIWVQTKIDLLADVELQMATQFNQSALNECRMEWLDLSKTIYSVSAQTGAGVEALTEALTLFDAETLKRMRRDWHWKMATAYAKPLLNHLAEEHSRLDAIREQLTANETMLDRDLDEIRAGMLATLAHLSDYVLGNLTDLIYHADPSTLSGLHGTIMADDQLRQVRDQLLNEVERALFAVRQSAIESIPIAIQSAPTFPVIPQWTLPDPPRQTVTIRITERRRFRPSQIDAPQTVKAYRAAVAHSSDQYAAIMTPLLEAALDGWQSQTAAWFTDQRSAIAAEYRKITEWLDNLGVWL